MFSRIRKRLTYANVAMTLALVFAMSGGAFAAGKFLIVSTKQISPKVLKALEGKAGPAGPRGEKGAAGPAGPAGKVEQGPEGKAGANGKDGVSVTSEAAGAECKAGGTKFTSVSGASFVCNGEKGAKGATGEPWTPNSELPSGATEHGVWDVMPLAKETLLLELRIPISFPIALGAPLESTAVHVFEGESIPSGCTGEVEGSRVVKLGAEKGNLCVYMASKNEIKASELLAVNPETGGLGVGRTGVVLGTAKSPEGASAVGYWALTAP